VAEVARQIDGGHSALAELALDVVAVGEHRAEVMSGVGQIPGSRRGTRERWKRCASS
jgi:hypothetical protein